MAEPDLLERLTDRLAAGEPIDWSAEERAAGSESVRAAVRELRVVAAVTAFHDSIHSGEGPGALGSSVAMARSVLSRDASGPVFAGRRHEDDGPPPLQPGTRWGHFDIREHLGRGSFGDVYRARDTKLDRTVALKLLRGAPASAGKEVIREARLLARVRHPNVVTVYGADQVDGRVGIWMEYLRGETLGRLLDTRGVLDAREAALIGIDVCRALSAVHAAGIAHRDVKPANIMRAEGGRIVLMDFGLGYEAAAGPDAAGAISGTPLFMAPEVLEGRPADERGDIYALGVVLFALVTRALPVPAADLAELRARHARHDARRARDLRPDLPEAFERVLDRALDADPAARFASAGEMERALLATLGATVLEPSRHARARSVWWGWPALGVALVTAAAAVLLASRGLLRTGGPAPVVHRVPLADQPDQVLLGQSVGDFFGLTVSGVGDIDLDGYDDVAIAAPLADYAGPESGRVYLHRGGPDGLEPVASWTFDGDGEGAYLGNGIAPATNIDLGGYADLLIGASHERTGEGRVHVFHGSREGLPDRPFQTIRAAQPGTLFGFSISTGDVNHDGHEDLLVGEPRHPPDNSGRAYLYLAVADSYSVTPAWTYTGPRASYFGIEVTLTGDFNKDGYADAAIGASTTPISGPGTLDGAAYIFLGNAAGLDSIPIVIRGRQPEGMFGRGMIAADMDGDGFSDLCVGSENGSNGESAEGVAEIFFGQPGGVSHYGSVLLESNNMGANFGGHGGALGDLDGDGCDEIFLGALRYQRTEPRAGAAFVVSGARDRAIRPTWLRVSPAGGAWYGGAGAGAGDIDGDTFPDVVIAAPSWDQEGGLEMGRVEVFRNTRRR